jgi:hypothetical protein
VLRPILIVLGALIAKLYNDSGKLIFRTVGASVEQQHMCKTMFAFFGLLKFDLQLGVSLLISGHFQSYYRETSSNIKLNFILQSCDFEYIHVYLTGNKGVK